MTNRGTRMHALHLPVSVRDSTRKLMKWLGAWDFQFVPDPEITELSISKPDCTLNPQVNFLQYTGNHFTKCVAMIKKTCKLVFFLAATTQCKCTLSTRLRKKKKKTPKKRSKKPELSISKPDYTLNPKPKTTSRFSSITHNHFTECVTVIEKTCKLAYFSQLPQHNADVPYLQDWREKKTPQSNGKDQLQISELSISKLDYGIPHSLIFFLLHTIKKTCKLGFFPSCYNTMQMYIYEIVERE